MPADEPKALMKRFYDEVVNGRKLELLDEVIADDFVEHEEFPGVTPNKEGVKQFFATMQAAFPDLRFEPKLMLAEGDTVASLITFTGTHQGEFMGVPATGKQISVQAVDIVRFRDGKAVDHWGTTDALTLLTQLGAIPAPTGA